MIKDTQYYPYQLKKPFVAIILGQTIYSPANFWTFKVYRTPLKNQLAKGITDFYALCETTSLKTI